VEQLIFKNKKMNFIEEKIINKGNLEKLKLRFPPEPNGYLHIGHAKSICLNFGLAEKYNKICNLRFDDTNPTSEDSHFVESIKNDIKWLGYNWEGEVKFTSDYFNFIYDCAVVLIKKGLAYVDDSTSEEIALLKGTTTLPGKPSPYYSRTVEENLDLFEKMKSINKKVLIVYGGGKARPGAINWLKNKCMEDDQIELFTFNSLINSLQHGLNRHPCRN
jgi:glutaminyl-tRNA synthetase